MTTTIRSKTDIEIESPDDIDLRTNQTRVVDWPRKPFLASQVNSNIVRCRPIESRVPVVPDFHALYRDLRDEEDAADARLLKGLIASEDTKNFQDYAEFRKELGR